MKQLAISILCCALLLGVSAGCATAPSSRPVNGTAVGEKVEHIAKALLRYQEQNQQLPPTLMHLVPQYLTSQDLVLQEGLVLLPFLQCKRRLKSAAGFVGDKCSV